MEGKPAVDPINPDLLSTEEKRMALEAVNLIKLKRDGILKRRTCANGKKHRRFEKDGEISSLPTVSLESIIVILIVDTYEGRTVCTTYVSGAYLYVAMPAEKQVLLKLVGKFVDIMCEVNPAY